MPCYKPLLRTTDLTKWEKALDGHLYHPAKIEGTTKLEKYRFFSTPYKRTELIPCGNCIGCRLDYSRDWANRGYLEMQESQNVYFVTLTHDDEHHFKPEEIIVLDNGKIIIPEEGQNYDGFSFTELPSEEWEWKGCLIPEEMTAFMKSLRQIMKREYNHDGIRFMLCGEYGTKEKREHYHIILFNCPLPLKSFYKPRISWQKDIYYQNTIIEKAWSEEKIINGKRKMVKKGIINITQANWNTIAYVSRYITKKINGKESPIHYAIQGEVKEFFRTSRGGRNENEGGIGYKYFMNHKNEIYKNDKVLIVNSKGSHYTTPPKYFDNLLEKENPELMKKIKEERKIRQLYKLRAKAQTTNLNQWEQLQVEMGYKDDKLKALKRDLY